MPGLTDIPCFVAMTAALTQQPSPFALVSFGMVPNKLPTTSMDMPSAVFSPDTWTEADGVDPTDILRTVTYRLTITVRDEDPATRFSSLDSLASLAVNRLDGLALGPSGVAALSQIRTGRFDPQSRHPESALILSGSFTSIIGASDQHGEGE